MVGMIRGIWTHEPAVARFRELVAAREPFSVIAATMNTEFGCALTRNAAIGKARRLGLGRGGFVIKKRPLDESTLPAPSLPGMDEAVDAVALERQCTIWDLTNETCRWPLGGATEPAKFFCGDPSANLENRMPYCPRHWRRAYGGYGWWPR